MCLRRRAWNGKGGYICAHVALHPTGADAREGCREGEDFHPANRESFLSLTTVWGQRRLR